MKSLAHVFVAFVLLSIIGISFILTPYGQKLEEQFGLPLLFHLRGPRKPPPEAVIVNIDNESSKKLGLPQHYSKWPRTIHAELVDKLVEFGAAVIAFDVHFGESKNEEQDMVFARAIKRAGNVILVEKLEHTTLKPSLSSPSPYTIEMDVLVPPIASLSETCLALAPFPLPKLPVRVDSAWLFKNTSGDVPTLPAAVFQAANLMHYDSLQSILRENGVRENDLLPETAEQMVNNPGLVETMRRMRSVFYSNSSLGEDIREGIVGLEHSADISAYDSDLLNVVDMYGSTNTVFIDFYGPPATFTTFSYFDILSAAGESAGQIREKVKGRVVFIGAARSTWSNQKDGFYTVFSQKDGLDLSGVELAATVFTNLCENRFVHKLSVPGVLVLLVLSAAVTCLASFLLQPVVSIPLLLAGVGAGIFGAHMSFSFDGTWVPVVTPLVIVPFAAFISGTLTNYFTTHRKRKHISKALGFYLPDDVVEELAKDLSFIDKGEKKVYSTCLMSDAQGYTTLSERMSPETLSAHIKEYYQYLFREVKKRDGVVGNVIGDSMLALWPSPHPDASRQLSGCRAALQIIDAVKRFNSKHPDNMLPTRIGLHSGYLLMDNIGAEDHFEYAPVGDIVNTASRIEGLNKRLGTLVLASEETVLGISGIMTRELGRFILGGKTQPVRIYELFSDEDLVDEKIRLYKELFPEALELFHCGKWKKALNEFDHCLSLYAEDGPSRFYKNLCGQYLLKPPPMAMTGVVKVAKS